LHKNGRFANAGLAGYQNNAGWHNTAAKDGVNIGDAGAASALLVGIRDFGKLLGFKRLALTGGYHITTGRLVGGLFYKAIPATAVVAAASPLATHGPTLLTHKLACWSFGHISILP
jgi:hypothetical protein